MRKVLILFLPLILTACIWGGTGAPLLPEDLCQEFDKSQSVILKVAAQHNIQLNEAYWGFINTARLVAAFSESPQETKDFYKLWLSKIRIYYEDNYPNISLANIIKYMTDEAEWGDRIELILAVMQMNYSLWIVNDIISEYDDCMLRAAWSDTHRQLFLGEPLKESWKLSK